MGITIQTAQSLIEKVVLVLTYFMSVPILGCFRAWVAKRMGDDTPQDLGFLSLNPVEHVSMLWLSVLVILRTNFAFGRYIPINPFNIQGKSRWLKLSAAYLSDACMGLIISTVSLFIFVAVLRVHPAALARKMFNDGTTGLLASIANYVPLKGASNFEVMLALLLLSLVVFNVLLAAFNVIINAFYIIFFAFFSPSVNSVDHVNWIMFIVPLIALSFLITPVEFLMYKFIFYAATVFGLLIGAF